jgi:uncharacterized protein YmfQ (DUF2313 family)
MSDRHLRRDGNDYRDAFLELLPQGEAWPKHSPESVLWKACDGLNDYWGFVDGRAADLLERESDPRQTVELLPDWERNWGLPDPCYSAPQTVAQRQTALIARMTLWGSQSRQWYINFAAFLGYGITITEYRPWMVGFDQCGDARIFGNGTFMQDVWGRPILNPSGVPLAQGELSEWPSYGLGRPENRYYWTVHVKAKSLVWFRCASGQCGVDPHLRIGIPQDLECILARWKPAHTQIIFDFTGVEGSALYEGADTASGVGGIAGFVTSGNTVALEARDTLAATSLLGVTGTAAIVERNDSLVGITTGALLATGTPREMNDSMAANGAVTTTVTTIFTPSVALNQDWAETTGGVAVTISASNTNQDNYETWNLDHGTSAPLTGPYFVALEGWNTAYAPWSESITVHTNTFPNNTLIQFAIPQNSPWAGVFMYPSVDYGETGSWRFPTGSNRAVPYLQIKNINNVSVTFNWTKNFADEDSDIMMEHWSFPNPTANQATNEISFYAWIYPTYAHNLLTNGEARNLNFTSADGTFNAFCTNPSASGTGTLGSPPQLKIIPVTGPGSRTLKQMVDAQGHVSGTFPAGEVMKFFVANGWMNGNDYIIGGQMGPEPTGNNAAASTGSCTLNSISWTWS